MPLRAARGKIWSDWPLLIALGITVLAGALRIPPLADSLWLDELHTAWCALGPLDEVAQRAALGNQSPVFFWLQWLLLFIVGEGETALRLPSLIAGTLLPLTAFLFARRWKADTAGLVAAGLIAVDPLSVFYATEARPYAIVQLLAVLFFSVTAQLAQHPVARTRLTWVLLAAALFYLHYTSALLIAAAAIFLATAQFIRGGDFKYKLVNLVVEFSLVALLCSLAIPNVSHIFAHRANWAAFIKPLPLWQAMNWTPLPWWAWLLLVLAALVGWRLSARQLSQPSLGSAIVLVLVWLIIPLTTAWFLTATDVARLFFPRYVAATFPAAMLLAGFCVGALPMRWAKTSAGVGTAVIALWSGGILGQMLDTGQVIADRQEDWRGCIAWLNERVSADGSPILVYSGLIESDELAKPHDALLEEYCLCPVISLYRLDAAPSDMFPLPLHQPGELPQAAEQLILHRGGCWLVVRGNNDLARNIAEQIFSGIQRSMPAASPARRAFHSESFGKVQVVQIRLD